MAKKRNHFIPRFYLRLFSSDETFIWVHTRTQPPAHKGIGIAGSQRGLYDKKTEDDFEQQIEGKASIAIKHVVEAAAVTLDERKIIARFISTMLRRGPQHKPIVDRFIQRRSAQMKALLNERHLLAQVGLAPEDVEKMSPEQREKTKQILAQKLREANEQLGTYEREPDPLFFRHNAYRESQLDDALVGMGWKLCYSALVEFVTSDDPVIMPIAGVKRPGAKLIFPLSRRACLIASPGWRGTEVIFAHHLEAHELNKWIVANAYEQIFASSKELHPELKNTIASAESFHRRSA